MTEEQLKQWWKLKDAETRRLKDEPIPIGESMDSNVMHDVLSGTDDMIKNAHPAAKKHLSNYHKCLFALIKVLSKRMRQQYSTKFRSRTEYETMEVMF